MEDRIWQNQKNWVHYSLISEAPLVNEQNTIKCIHWLIEIRHILTRGKQRSPVYRTETCACCADAVVVLVLTAACSVATLNLHWRSCCICHNLRYLSPFQSLQVWQLYFRQWKHFLLLGRHEYTVEKNIGGVSVNSETWAYWHLQT